MSRIYHQDEGERGEIQGGGLPRERQATKQAENRAKWLENAQALVHAAEGSHREAAHPVHLLVALNPHLADHIAAEPETTGAGDILG